MKFFSKGKSGDSYASSKADEILDKVLYTFPNGKDTLTIREAVEGCFITGAVGSGKSSGFANQYFKSMIDAGMGGLIINVKSDADDEMLNLINQSIKNENNTF